MIYTIIAVLVAAGLKLIFGWPFWTILIVIGVGAGLAYIKTKNNVLAGWLSLVIVLIFICTITFQFVSGKFPLTASLSSHILLGQDTKVAANLSEPLVKARAAALVLQTAREDAAANEVKRLYIAGKPYDALRYIQKLEAEGELVRAVVNHPKPEPKKPVAPATEEKPAATAPAQPVQQAVVAQAIDTPPAPVYTNFSGIYRICLNGSCSNYTIVHAGKTISSEAYFIGGGKLVLSGNETALGKFTGKIREDSPMKNEEWKFSGLRLENQWSGNYTDQNNFVGSITVDKIS